MMMMPGSLNKSLRSPRVGRAISDLREAFPGILSRLLIYGSLATLILLIPGGQSSQPTIDTSYYIEQQLDELEREESLYELQVSRWQQEKAQERDYWNSKRIHNRTYSNGQAQYQNNMPLP